MNSLQNLSAELKELFRTREFRAAHEAARPLLERAAADDRVLHDALEAAISRPGFLDSLRINPVVAVPMIDSAEITLVANCWIPRPDGDTTLSHQSIHHHGNLLLTSVCAFGPGYESILFGRVDPRGRSADLQHEKTYRNVRGNCEFVDSYAPHVVFYPESLSITFALWSREKARTGGTVARGLLPRPLKKPLGNALRKIGLASAFDINQDRDLDYHVLDGRFHVLGKRAMYSPGTNESFLKALHFVAKEVGLPAARGLAAVEARLGSHHAVNSFEEKHLFVPGATLSKREILECL